MINKLLNLPALERDFEEKRLTLEADLKQLMNNFREEIRPKSLLRKHPKFIIGSVISGLSILKMVSGFVFSRKIKNKSSYSAFAWPWQLAALAGKMGLRFFMPLALTTLKFAFKKSLGK